MGLCKNHPGIYFDNLIRQKKTEAVLSLINATYYTNQAIDIEDKKKEIARRLEFAYNLFKGDAGTYSGDEKQFASHYTIGHEMGIWKNSNLELSDMALEVANNRITIREYFDRAFLNYIQPVNGQIVHILYPILEFMEQTGKNQISKEEMTVLYKSLGKTDDSGNINGVFNMLLGTNYFISDVKGKILIYVWDEPVEVLKLRCNTKYVKLGYKVTQTELDTQEKYANYLLSDNMDEEEVMKEKHSVKLNFKPLGDKNKINNYNTITFGAPGTGKSYKIKSLVETTKIDGSFSLKIENDERAFRDENIERVTFHPNYGYPQFIGTYKPVSKGKQGISYEYVPGPFIRIFREAIRANIAPQIAEKKIDAAISIIKSLDKYIGMESSDKYSSINESIKNASENIKKDVSLLEEVNKSINGVLESIETLVKEAEKIVEEAQKNEKDTSKILSDLKKKSGKETTQAEETPELITEETGNDVSEAKSSKLDEATKKAEEAKKIAREAEEKAEMMRTAMSVVTDAREAVNIAESLSSRRYLLVVEEINRANVAAVFGDIFQLLDRTSTGESTYDINTSEDLKVYLSNYLEITPESLEKIKIPNNMYIWSTMNSADQGVLPMDAAFKRRWNFEYIGINDGEEKVKDIFVSINDKKINWNVLRKEINKKIQENVSGVNEDKLLGPFFINFDTLNEVNVKNEKEGTEEYLEKQKEFSKIFKSKVIMYLYEDVCKMDPVSLFSGFSTNDKTLYYSEICDYLDGINSSSKESKDIEQIGLNIFGKNFEKMIIDLSNELELEEQNKESN